MSSSQTPSYTDLAKSTAFHYAKKAGWSAQKFTQEFYFLMDEMENEESSILEEIRKELRGEWDSVLWIVRGRRCVEDPEAVARDMIRYHVANAILKIRRV